MEFPVGVFGLALATVVLPSLSKTVAEGNQEKYNATLDWALRWVILITVPAMLGLIVLAVPMLTTLFYYGEFTVVDVQMSSYSLIAYSVGLSGFILIKILAAGFYSRQDTKTPVKIAIIAMAANMVGNIVLIYPLQHAGLALATALAACLNAGLLFYHLRKQGLFQAADGWMLFSARVTVASAAMITLLWFSGDLSYWVGLSMWARGLELLGWIVAGLVCYAVVLLVAGMRRHHLSL